MTDDATHVRATLDAWREQGAHRLDPVRFHRLDALEKRAAAFDGDARALLDARLATLLEGFAEIVARAGEAAAASETAQASAQAPARGALGGLVEQLARDAQADRRGVDPELIDYFRTMWSKVRTEQQYRQSLDQVPRNAGPLNSNSLVHRSLATMRELSPEYLQQFLSYIDALAWLEDLAGGGAQPEKEAPRAKAAKPAKPAAKPARKTTRTKAR
ncbi:hypothetical protein CH72_5443 [Burkholderia ambifaria AMMD]|uniref:Uncharacterized protein n=1 Tax=Burkholderia ambifaria (strain ATCC BAA-244 / DSM 16087 / CCUG 44356 / LMG 19182 / AMMD) TaxID=339670 RepID=Q0B4H4_BURCM|nr:DUF2894 domain-containing protein [Burkholderia ambifaria]ABI90949.1 conserved hypothetical protein [Burkholderia ambifaria AMMD]AJY25412.1 hypothetical protein CH72_5443 [Burkholderia ambifaria AMMD]MBR7932867.1 DUF2894 domain-containing protein [Burkholderia ambifaria]PEH68937.1 DUF2894 domain-containing protein [Burkholderia ambifaria]QQC06470.1 DUF2894 domain-containing protein [Burkholderia ambifaria]